MHNWLRHWRRLVKNIGWANQNIGRGHKVVKSEKCMGVYQLFGGTRPGCPPKSMPIYLGDGRPCLKRSLAPHN